MLDTNTNESSDFRVIHNGATTHSSMSLVLATKFKSAASPVREWLTVHMYAKVLRLLVSLEVYCCHVIVDVLSDGLEDVSTFRFTRERCWVGSLKVNVKQSRLKVIDDSLVNSFHDELIITVTERRYH